MNKLGNTSQFAKKHLVIRSQLLLHEQVGDPALKEVGLVEEVFNGAGIYVTWSSEHVKFVLAHYICNLTRNLLDFAGDSVEERLVVGLGGCHPAVRVVSVLGLAWGEDVSSGHSSTVLQIWELLEGARIILCHSLSTWKQTRTNRKLIILHQILVEFIL